MTVKRGGPGRGQGNKRGSQRVQDPKREVLSQRYSEGEKRLIESVAGGEVGTFIHDAAVDRARQFAELTDELLNNTGNFGMTVIERGEG